MPLEQDKIIQYRFSKIMCMHSTSTQNSTIQRLSDLLQEARDTAEDRSVIEEIERTKENMESGDLKIRY